MPGAQHRVRAAQDFFVGPVVIHYHVNSVQIIRIQSVPTQHFRSKIALQRSKLQVPACVSLEQKLNAAITQPANAVIKND